MPLTVPLFVHWAQGIPWVITTGTILSDLPDHHDGSVQDKGRQALDTARDSGEHGAPTVKAGRFAVVRERQLSELVFTGHWRFPIAVFRGRIRLK